jgi:N-acetylglutamate synthase-like GNAT family acetyltransferase
VLTGTFYIADSSLAMRYYDDLQKQLENEWRNFPPINRADRAIPKPLVALTSCNDLAGGLAFTAAKSPLSDELEIWINAVLVAPEYRRQGVGSRLIRAAQEAARRAGVPRLYALTELPDLYSKLDWSMLSSDGADFVLTWNCGVRRSDGKRSS